MASDDTRDPGENSDIGDTNDTRRNDVDDLIASLGLEPHPEGGWYVQTWQARGDDGRAAGTAIYFLLRSGEVSHWHRIDSAEIWHHYAGDPLELSTWSDGGEVRTHLLGDDLRGGARPQVIVEPGAWQSARSLGAWTLVGCTVSPGFEFEHFELAEPGWAPGRLT